MKITAKKFSNPGNSTLHSKRCSWPTNGRSAIPDDFIQSDLSLIPKIRLVKCIRLPISDDMVVWVMKTTVDIADAILTEAKALAALRSITLRELIEDSLRNVLATNQPAKPFRLEDGSVHGNGLQRPMTWDEMIEESSRGHTA